MSFESPGIPGEVVRTLGRSGVNLFHLGGAEA
jgi:hypothetical protein